MKSKTLSLKTIIKKLDFLIKISYSSMKHLTEKDLLSVANKLGRNIPDPRNATEHYQSLLIKKNRKSLKQSEIISYRASKHFTQII